MDKRRVEWKGYNGGVVIGPKKDDLGNGLFLWGDHSFKIKGDLFTESDLKKPAPAGFPKGQYSLQLRYTDADSNSNAVVLNSNSFRNSSPVTAMVLLSSIRVSDFDP